MSQRQLHWVHKNVGSESVSHSSRREEAKIRRHVQATRKRQASSEGETTYASASAAFAVDRPSRTRSYHAALAPVVFWRWKHFSAVEQRSLEFFRVRTCRDWTGWTDAPFWKTLVLQVCQQSEAIAKGLIALSALQESFETTESTSKAELESLSLLQSRQAVKSAARSRLSYFEALVSCLVLICLHNLQGCRGSFRLLGSGIKLLEHCEGRFSTAEAETVEFFIRPLFDRLRCRPCRMSDAATALTLSVQRHRARNPAYDVSECVTLVPHSFGSLEDARNCLGAILNWAHDTMPYRMRPEDPAMSCFLKLLHTLQESWEGTLRKTVNFKDDATSKNSLKLLVAACICGIILIETVGSHEEMIYDRYLSHFSGIMTLVEQTTASLDYPTASFGIDGGLLDIVAFVGTKCRDPMIRRRALQFLRRGMRMEGDRIASTTADILQAHIELEESGLSDVSSCINIPASHRRVLLYGRQYVAQQRIELTFATSSTNNHGPGDPTEIRTVSLLSTVADCSAEAHCSDVPDAIFGPGYAAFLENRQSNHYFRLDLDRFYFPIPRV